MNKKQRAVGSAVYVGRYCHGKSSIHPSVCLSVCLCVCPSITSWSHRLEYFENNCTTDYRRVFGICRPQRQGSAPNFSSSRSGVGAYCKNGSRPAKQAMSQKRLKIERKLLLTAYIKSCMISQLVPKRMT